MANVRTMFYPSQIDTKILVSVGFNKGWVTWNDPRNLSAPEFIAWMITYQPLIEFVERHENWVQENCNQGGRNGERDFESKAWEEKRTKLHESRAEAILKLTREFDREAERRFSVRGIRHDGAPYLVVKRVSRPFMLEEKNGRETIIDLVSCRKVALPKVTG